MSLYQELLDALPSFPNSIVDLIENYTGCYECQAISDSISALEASGCMTIRAYANQDYEYNDTLSVHIFGRTFTVDYESETGTCDYCMSSSNRSAVCDRSQLVIALAHRLPISTLVNQTGFYDISDDTHHKTLSYSNVRFYENSDLCGLMMRVKLLGEDFDDYHHQDRFYEGDSDEGDSDEGDSDADDDSPVIPGLHRIPVSTPHAARPSDIIPDLDEGDESDIIPDLDEGDESDIIPDLDEGDESDNPSPDCRPYTRMLVYDGMSWADMDELETAREAAEAKADMDELETAREAAEAKADMDELETAREAAEAKAKAIIDAAEAKAKAIIDAAEAKAKAIIDAAEAKAIVEASSDPTGKTPTQQLITRPIDDNISTEDIDFRIQSLHLSYSGISDDLNRHRDSCSECDRLYTALIAILDHESQCGYISVADGWYGEGIELEVRRKKYCYDLSLTFSNQIGTCVMCENYERDEEHATVSIWQLVMILAHRLELRHAFEGRLYDETPSPSVHPGTIRRIDCRGYNNHDDLAIRLRCKVLDEDYESLYGAHAKYDDESNIPAVSPLIPGLFHTTQSPDDPQPH
jgi:hypothetical protein